MAFHYSPKIVTDGLVFLLDAANTKSYPGSGTVWTDLAGPGKTGTLTNGPTFSSAKHGAIVLDGSNDYIQTNFVYSLPTITTNFTAGVWVNVPTNSVTYGQSVISNYYSENDSTTLAPFNLAIRGGNASNAGKFSGYSKGDGGSSHGLYSTSRVDGGGWHYCVYSKNNNLYTVYVNGVSENTTTSVLGITTITHGMTLGNLNYYLNQGWLGGSIAHLTVHNRALTATEVLQNYNATKTRFI